MLEDSRNPRKRNLGELPLHPKLQINNLVDLSTVAATQISNRSRVKIHSA
jgi:hypothetical protein